MGMVGSFTTNCECPSFNCVELIEVEHEDFRTKHTREVIFVSSKCQFGVNPKEFDLIETCKGYTIYKTKEKQ